MTGLDRWHEQRRRVMAQKSGFKKGPKAECSGHEKGKNATDFVSYQIYHTLNWMHNIGCSDPLENKKNRLAIFLYGYMAIYIYIWLYGFQFQLRAIIR